MGGAGTVHTRGPDERDPPTSWLGAARPDAPRGGHEGAVHESLASVLVQSEGVYVCRDVRARNRCMFLRVG